MWIWITSFTKLQLSKSSLHHNFVLFFTAINTLASIAFDMFLIVSLLVCCWEGEVLSRKINGGLGSGFCSGDVVRSANSGLVGSDAWEESVRWIWEFSDEWSLHFGSFNSLFCIDLYLLVGCSCSCLYGLLISHLSLNFFSFFPLNLIVFCL